MAVSLKGCGFDGLGQFDVQLLKAIPRGGLSNAASPVSSKSRDNGPADILILSETPKVMNVCCDWEGTFVYVCVGSREASFCSTEWYDTLLSVTDALPGEVMVCNVWGCGSELLVKTTDDRVMNVAEMKEIEQLHGCQGCHCCQDGRPYYLLPGDRVCVGRDLCPLDYKVTKVACGADHTLLLMTDGSVYSRGHSTRGQLGHGDLLPHTGPCVIEALWGVAIKDIACGLWHSVALSTQGDVYSWGWNKDGQLGHSADSHFATLPGLLELELECISVSCGARHSAVLCESGNEAIKPGYGATQSGDEATALYGSTTSQWTKSGTLLVYGWNDYQQTSCNNTDNILFTACGRWSTLFLQKHEL